MPLDQKQPCSATLLPPHSFLFVSLHTSILPKILTITKNLMKIRMERRTKTNTITIKRGTLRAGLGGGLCLSVFIFVSLSVYSCVCGGGRGGEGEPGCQMPLARCHSSIPFQLVKPIFKCNCSRSITTHLANC